MSGGELFYKIIEKINVGQFTERGKLQNRIFIYLLFLLDVDYYSKRRRKNDVRDRFSSTAFAHIFYCS